MMPEFVPKPFIVDFNTLTGMSESKSSTTRKLSQMKGMFADDTAFEEILKGADPLVYEFYELEMPSLPNELLFGTSITYPGKVGNEYFMTKGHFHRILDTAEVYYCLSGEGFMMMETPEGEISCEALSSGKVVYVPPRWAHRSINSGSVPLVTFFVYRADAGHDYGTIETKGYRKLLVEQNGKPEVVDNPKWR